MGSTDSKLNFRKAVIQLTTKTQVGYEQFIYIYSIQLNKSLKDRASGRTEEHRRRDEGITLATQEQKKIYINKNKLISCCMQPFRVTSVY